MTDSGAVAYLQTVPDGWAEVVDGWPWEPSLTEKQALKGWRKRGECPRCAHKISVYVNVVFAVDTIPPLDAQCNCAQPHEGRAADADPKGCGAHGQIATP